MSVVVAREGVVVGEAEGYFVSEPLSDPRYLSPCQRGRDQTVVPAPRQRTPSRYRFVGLRGADAFADRRLRGAQRSAAPRGEARQRKVKGVAVAGGFRISVNYDRTHASLFHTVTFDYREFLRRRRKDYVSQTRLIFYDLLHSHDEEALDIYEQLIHDDVTHRPERVAASPSSPVALGSCGVCRPCRRPLPHASSPAAARRSRRLHGLLLSAGLRGVLLRGRRGDLILPCLLLGNQHLPHRARSIAAFLQVPRQRCTGASTCTNASGPTSIISSRRWWTGYGS